MAAFLRDAKEGAMTTISEIFSAQVPRYTSYPTAPHFSDAVGPVAYLEWLAQLPSDEPLSLYLHIPFCDTLCWFCGCHTSVVNHYAPVRDYCTLLEREIALVAKAMTGRRAVRHIHFGGGSPTMLDQADIRRLGACLHLHFDILPDAEIAIEADPRGLTEAVVEAFAAIGVNRASIGVQDCNPQVQRAINRIQSDQETVQAIALLRRAGVRSINIDLLYGLPHQTLQSWKETLDFARTLDPDRLAVFGYAHVPSFKKHQALISTDALPNIGARFRMAELARETLCAHGYMAIGLDHFAKPGDSLAQAKTQGRLCRNFQGYTTDRAESLIGLGASAIGSLPQGYVQNVAAVPAYRTLLTDGKLPVTRGFRLSQNDRMHRDAIQSLMCDMAVDLDAVARTYGRTRGDFREALDNLEPMAIRGIVAIRDGRIALAPQWHSAVRVAAAAFDEYLHARKAIHSSPI
jgi:oxygen-independent coproporphyrinogen-3 oxidase